MLQVVWLNGHEVQAIHHQLIAEFGGLLGIRDLNMLESALARPQNIYAYGQSPTLVQLAAAYGFGLAKNHPFLDGNKRIALAAIGVFLDLNGWQLYAPQTDAVATILALAAGELSEDDLAHWIEANIRPRA
ncbi:MAG: type II toxin-antitoxin system death-on-curing family toxin [Bryobacteraceae bacterium]